MRRTNGVKSFAVIALSLAAACTSSQTASPSKPPIASSSTITNGGTVITDEMIGRRRGTMHLTETANDRNYGYSANAPIRIGGGFGDGGDRTYKYLNSLLGPHGEKVTYRRVGTCCAFKTPNSPIGGEGLLEVYEITVGDAAAKQIYFDWHDDSPPLIPVGLSALP